MRCTVSTIVVIVAALWAAGCGGLSPDGMVDVPMTDAEANPLFTRSTLPYQLPPFDQIENAHYRPAFERGMTEHLAEIEAIIDVTNAPTLENTLVPLERSGELLTRVESVFFSLNSADTNDAMDEIRVEMAPKLAAHRDRILLNGELFSRVKALYDQRDVLDVDAESRRLIEEYYIDFVRAGAELSKAKQERMQEINAELAGLETTFSQNVLDEVNASAVVVKSRDALAGLSENRHGSRNGGELRAGAPKHERSATVVIPEGPRVTRADHDDVAGARQPGWRV